MKTLPKVTAFVTVIFYLFTSLGWTQPVQNPPAEPAAFKLPSKIEIPGTLGTVQSVDLSASNKPLVIYIQDAHAVSEAQENIQKLIAHFQSIYPVRKVLLEGLSGKMDTVLARTFPDPFLREKVMGRYFVKGEMTGAEMAAVFSSGSVSYEGLEETALYEENIRTYLEASALKPQMAAEIQSREKTLTKEADLVNSPEQKKLLTLVEHFDAGSENFPELLHYMAGFRKEAAKYPRLKLLLDTAAEDNPEDLKKAELSFEKMAESFRSKQLGRLSAEHQKTFQEQFQAFRVHQLDAGVFLKTLIELAEPLGVKPRLTPELESLLKKNEILSSLQGGEVFEEMESLIRDLEDQHAKTPEAKKFLEQVRALRLLKKLSALELTRKQWETLSSNHAELLKEEMWKPAVHFYETALKRDQEFHEKLKKAAEKQSAVIAVAGGFHAQGFEAYLKENHYPYVSILPSLHSLAGQEKYEALMQGKVSWAPEVRTSLYDGFMRHLSKQLTAEVNASERPLRLKLWRDEVIRALVKEGKIAQAGDYTKYIAVPGTGSNNLHEKIQAEKIRTLDFVWKTFESQFAVFNTGFNQLLRDKKLTVDNVSALLLRAGSVKPSMLSPSLAKFDPSYRGGFIKFLPSGMPQKRVAPVIPSKVAPVFAGSRFEERRIHQALLQNLQDEDLLKLHDLVNDAMQQKKQDAKWYVQYLWKGLVDLRVYAFFYSILLAILVVTLPAILPLNIGRLFWRRIDLFLFFGGVIGVFGMYFYVFRYYSPRLYEFVFLKIEQRHLLNEKKLIGNELESRGLIQTEFPDEQSSETEMRAENRVIDHDNDIFREEFLAFLEGKNSEDSPRGDLRHLGSVGQRLRESVQYLLDHSHHYHYAGPEEMWTDVVEMLWERRQAFALHLHDGEPVNHYVEIAAKHALIDRYRKMIRSQKDSGAGMDTADPENVLDELLEDIHEMGPDQSAIASESGIYLDNALKHLSFDEANLIHLHFWDQMSYHEIAEALGLNEGTVRNRILRAMENLKPWLPHQDWAPEESFFISKIPEEEIRALNAVILTFRGISGGKKHPEKTVRVQRMLQLYRDGKDYSEIARDTDAPEGTVKRTIHRAKEILSEKDQRLTATLLALRSENGGQTQKRNENRHVDTPRVTVYGGGDDEGPGSSSFLIEFGNTKVLLDSGAGSRRRIEKNPPAHLDAILLSHAHNDHSGDLPWISEMFPDAPVYASEATKETALLMMKDAASFQLPQEKKSYRKNTLALKDRFQVLDPRVWYQITQELKIRFQPASHIPGANLIYIATPYRNYLYTGDFSGDALRAASTLELLDDFPLDELWEESTYGGAVSALSREEREQAFANDLSRVLSRGGKALIPTFAIGRTADVAATIRHLQSLQAVPEAPIYVDGLAAYNLESYMRILSESKYAEDVRLYSLLEEGITFVTPSLRDDLQKGKIAGPFMILGGSGSLAGGRALQYFPGIASDPKNAVMIVGYQFPNTMGRDLKEGKREFKMGKGLLSVAADVFVHDFGAHARQHSLVALARKTNPRITNLIHGEIGAKESLRQLLEAQGLKVQIPKTGDTVVAEEIIREMIEARRSYFEGLNALSAEEIKKEVKQPLSFIYEKLTDGEAYGMIGALLVAFNLKSHDEEGHQIIRELIQKKRDEEVPNPFTAVILEVRTQLFHALAGVPQKRKNIVRSEMWNQIRVSTGREPMALPLKEPVTPKPGKRDLSLVIAERRQRTLDEFKANILVAFHGTADQSASPSEEVVIQVLNHFLDQSAVAITEGGRAVTLKLIKEDGGLISGNVARVIQFYLGEKNAKTEARWRNAWEGLSRDFGPRSESRELSLISLLLPPAQEIVNSKQNGNLREEALVRLQGLSDRFDRLEREVAAGFLEEPLFSVPRIFGEWTPYVNSSALTEILTAFPEAEEETLVRAKAFLNRSDLLQKHFTEFSQSDTVALESGLLFALSSDLEEISTALRQTFRWAGLFYIKNSSMEKPVLEIAKADNEHFVPIPSGGEKSVRSRKLGEKGNIPLVWAPGNVLNFSGDQLREARFKERGFQVSQETLLFLAAQKLSLKEALMLLKLFSVSKTLRASLPRGEDGFLILTGERLMAGIQTLAELWSREAESSRLSSRAA